MTITLNTSSRAALLAFTSVVAITSANAAQEETQTESQVAQAQQATAAAGRLDRLEEVVVTAERRASTLQETPLAVSAVTGESLREANLQVLRDLQVEVPSLVTPGFHANMQSVYIRGIGTSDPGVYPAVGQYIDDIYIPRTFGNGLFDLPDIERVEVLRGPQGTLYGQNTSAGAIKFISRDPTDVLTGHFDLGIGSYDTRDFRGYIAGALIPGVLSAGVAYTHRERDGYTRNAFLNKWTDGINSDQARIKLRYTGETGLDAVLSLDGTIDRSDSANYVALGYPGSSPRVSYSNVDQALKRDIGGVSLRVSYPISDKVTFKSISGVRAFDDDPSPWDQDATPAFTYGWTQFIHQRQFTQEFQTLGEFEGFNFTAGASLFREVLDFSRISVTNARFSELDSDIGVWSAGLYGQGTYNVTDQLSLTAGLRFNKEWQRFTNASYNIAADGTTRTTTIYRVNDLRDNWQALTPKIGIDYQWSPDLLTYVSWTKGQKSGGFNRAAATEAIARIPVQPEVVTTYEAGFKDRALNDRLQTNVAVFYNDFKDYIAGITNPSINGQTILGSVTVNAGKAHTYGVELESALILVRGLELKFSGAYLKAKFDEFANPTGAAASDFSNNRLPNAPAWTLGGSVGYVLPLPILGDVFVNARIRYVSSSFADVANRAVVAVPAQTYVDVGAKYTPQNANWSLGVNVTNATDELYRVTGTVNPAINVNTSGYNAPRMIVASLNYDF